MSFRKLSLVALTLAALAPSITLAGAEDHALKACVNAFAATLSGDSSPTVKLKYSRHAGSPLADYYAHEFTFTMQANNRKSNTTLAAVSCSATEQGTVIAMHPLRVNETVTLASR